MKTDYIINNRKLDEYQLSVINSNSNTLVIAGAGAGKTFTIQAKIKYLIEEKLCHEEEILVISFTNASVNDLKLKIKENVNIFTFHKLAISIIEKNNIEYNISSPTILEYIVTEYLKTCSDNMKKNILHFLNISYSYNWFLKSSTFKCFCNFIIKFINLYKANNISKEKINNLKLSFCEKNILLLIFKIYRLYLSEKNSTNSMDFDDLIIIATELVYKTNLNYKYIIIDEFQDTSYVRLNLIKKIYKKTNSKIIVVGDDYQSIYRFSGCDLNIFLNFKNYFPNVTCIKLLNTYRNSIELIKIATKFIEKNPLQISKKLCSSKTISNPIILVPYIDKKLTFKKVLDYLINISNDIMILSRNNNDIYSYCNKDFSILIDSIIYKSHIIKYYTVHKSKGLEAEYVILINCNDDYLGFPNKVENNSLIDKLLPSNEILYAEERRLFYVAITRCKKSVFLIYDKYNPSIFIKETKKIIKKTIHKVSFFK